jgi:threonine synthase
VPGYVSAVECAECGARYEPTRLLGVCERCGQMLAVRYDLERVRTAVRPGDLRNRPPSLYRFRELTPLAEGEDPVTLGEGSTPLLALPRLGAHVGLRHLWAKDEGQNPTGTFKARGLAMAVTRARTLGVRGVLIPSAGNAGGAAALYAARAGLPCGVVVPADTPPAALAEALLGGARVFTVDGSIATAGAVVARAAPALGWFDLSTLKEPYRLEGKKTMGLELAEQLGWRAPDLIVYPTGGGTGLLGLHKAFRELAALGWVTDPPPRFVTVQAEGCAPVVRAWRAGAEHTVEWERPVTAAAGLRVPAPFAGRHILRVLRETRGEALAVSDPALTEAQGLLARLEGIWTSLEGAATVAALLQLRDRGVLEPGTRVVLLLTGAGLTMPPPPLPAPRALGGSVEEMAARVTESLGAAVVASATPHRSPAGGRG